jgi:hypothetical protein
VVYEHDKPLSSYIGLRNGYIPSDLPTDPTLRRRNSLARGDGAKVYLIDREANRCSADHDDVEGIVR